MDQREQLFGLARRTFDTPDFRGITFIEAEAKTILNHVPWQRDAVQLDDQPQRARGLARATAIAALAR